MKYAIAILTFLSGLQAFAAGNVCEAPPAAKKGPSAAYLAKMKRLKELEEEVVKLRARNQDLEAHRVDVREIIANHPPIPVQFVEKEVPSSRPVKKNSLSLLVLTSRTGLQRDDYPNKTVVQNDPRSDVGIMYQRDFSRIRGSAAASARGTMLLGVGLTF